MTIDNTPAIRAFVQERINATKCNPFLMPAERAICIRELEMVVNLCDGLQKQNELIGNSMKQALGLDDLTETKP